MKIGLDAPLKRGNSSTLEETIDQEEFSATSPVKPKKGPVGNNRQCMAG